MLYSPVKPLKSHGKLFPDCLYKCYFPFYACSSGHVVTGPGFITTRDSRFDYQFILTIGGKGTLTVDEITYELTPGTLTLIDCRKLHSYGTYGNGEWEYKYIHLAGSGIKTYANHLLALPIVLKVSDIEPFEHCIDYYLDKSPLRTKSELALSCTKLSDLIFNLISQVEIAGMHENDREVNDTSMMGVVLTYIHDNFRKNITLEELAQLVYLSKYYMCHKFKEVTGQSPHQYILSLRLNYSRRLLRETDITVNEVAFECGFNSPGEFVRMFQQKAGKSPSEWRKDVNTPYSE